MELEQVLFRVSSNGVPHTLVNYRGYTFSICYFGKTNLYRIFLYKPENKKLLDIEMSNGGQFDIKFVLNGLIDTNQF